jgi:hypothetical protein
MKDQVAENKDREDKNWWEIAPVPSGDHLPGSRGDDEEEERNIDDRGRQGS